MYQPRPPDETQNQTLSQILAALTDGRPLLGGVLDWADQVIPHLVTVADDKVTVIDNAVFEIVDLALAKARNLVFRRCLFLEPVFNTGESIPGRVTFKDCRFVKPCILRGLAIGALKFDGCEFADRCSIDVVWQPDIFELKNCLFSGSLQLTLNGNGHSGSPTENHCAEFEHCEFRDRVVLQIQAPLLELFLENCEFSGLSETQITVPASVRTLSLQASRMLGKLEIMGPTNVELAQFVAEGANFWAPKLNFISTFITGNLNLRGIQFSSMNFQNASIVDGGLELADRQLRLADEDLPIPGPMGRFRRLSRQYEILSHALPRLPQTSEAEDTCVFRMRRYHLLADVERIGRGAYTFALVSVWTLLAELFVLVVWIPSPWPALGASATALGFAGLARNPLGWVPYRISKGFAAVWDRLVLGAMLGYGVRVKNVLGSAALCIVVFAAIFWTSSRYADHIGRIEVDDQNYVLLLERKAGLTKGVLTLNDWSVYTLAQVRDSLYYSVVTFTTVGYGEFTPQGRLRVVAACEALLGAVMIALVTVIFARKYLRL